MPLIFIHKIQLKKSHQTFHSKWIDKTTINHELAYSIIANLFGNFIDVITAG